MATGSWALIGNLSGSGLPFVPATFSGNKLYGAGVPADTLGAAGDTYLNTINGDLYQKSGYGSGPPGPPGAPGAPGAPGSDGEDGVSTPPSSAAGSGVGPQGPQGIPGSDAATLIMVTQAPDGEDGDRGPPGIPGPAGNDGGIGPQGPSGVSFLIVRQGDDGEDGNQGPPGPQGAQGPAGAGGGSTSAFAVHKNGTGQALTALTFATVTWPTELFDTGNNFASDTWTPPAGTVSMSVAVHFDGAYTSTGNQFVIALLKNGVALKQVGMGVVAGTGGNWVFFTVIDKANGTDAYTIQAKDGGTLSSGTRQILGTIAETWWTGSLL